MDSKWFPVVATAIFAGMGTLVLFMLGGISEEVNRLRPRVQQLEKDLARQGAQNELQTERINLTVSEVTRLRELEMERCDGG